MPAPKPPIPSLFFWLAVSAFLLASAPAPRQTAGVAGEPQRLAATNALAKVFAEPDLAQTQDSAQLPQPWTGAAAAVPSSAPAGLPSFAILCRSALRPACTAVVPRRSLVGVIELRV